jgi:hypothetical protein
MEIIKKIQLNIKIEKDKILCYDTTTVNLVMGTSSASSNLHIHNIKKIKHNVWEIPIEQVNKRIEDLKNRIEKDTYRVNIMEQIINCKVD